MFDRIVCHDIAAVGKRMNDNVGFAHDKWPSLAAVLLTLLLFGGMVLYAFGFAAFLFTALPANC